MRNFTKNYIGSLLRTGNNSYGKMISGQDFFFKNNMNPKKQLRL